MKSGIKDLYESIGKRKFLSELKLINLKHCSKEMLFKELCENIKKLSKLEILNLSNN
jgi:hypothetical protein